MRKTLYFLIVLFCTVHAYGFEITQADCAGPESLRKKLNLIQIKLETQASNMKVKDFVEHLSKEDAFTNWLTSIAPYMIDKEVKSSGFYNGCWAFYEDFIKVLSLHQKKEYFGAAQVWKTCLMTRDRKLSPEVESVLKCVEKF